MQNKEETGFQIYQDSHHSFSFMNRIRILFGKKMHTKATITVDKDVIILKSELVGYVDGFFPEKDGGVEIRSLDNHQINN